MNIARKKRILLKLAQVFKNPSAHPNLKAIQGAVTKIQGLPKVDTSKLTLNIPKPPKPFGPLSSKGFKPSPPRERTLKFLTRKGTKALTTRSNIGGDTTHWRENVAPTKSILQRPRLRKETSQVTPGTGSWQRANTRDMVIDPQGRKRRQTLWGGGTGNLKEGVRIAPSENPSAPLKRWGKPVSTTGEPTDTPQEITTAHKKGLSGMGEKGYRGRPTGGKYRAPIKWYKEQ